jgi:hypothetical protein
MPLSAVRSDGMKVVCPPCQKGRHLDCTLHEKCGCEEATCNPPLLKWLEGPPPTNRGPQRPPPVNEDQIQELIAHPNKWAEVKRFKGKKTAAQSWASKIRKGVYEGMGEGFDATARVDGNDSILYVVYLGTAGRE